MYLAISELETFRNDFYDFRIFCIGGRARLYEVTDIEWQIEENQVRKG